MAFMNRAGMTVGPSRLAGLPAMAQRLVSGPSTYTAAVARPFSSSAHRASPPPPLAAQSPARRLDMARSFDALAARPSLGGRGPVTLPEPFDIPSARGAGAGAGGPNAEKDKDAWWRTAIQKTEGGHQSTGNQFSGRYINARPGRADFTAMYRTVTSIISRCGIRKDLKLMEFHEKRSDKRRRLESERHRRRFQEKVRQKVHAVQILQNRR